MNVVLNEANDLTVWNGRLNKPLKINEAKMIQGSLEMLPALARSLASLGMTE